MKLPSERVVFGAVLFTVLIGNPLRVIVDEAMKPKSPEPTITVTYPSSGISVTRTRSQWKAELATPKYDAYWERRMREDDFKQDPKTAALLYPKQTQAEQNYNNSQEDAKKADEKLYKEAMAKLEESRKASQASTDKLMRDLKDSAPKLETPEQMIEASNEAHKTTKALFPQPTTELPIPSNYKELCRTTGDYCEVSQEAVNKGMSAPLPLPKEDEVLECKGNCNRTP